MAEDRTALVILATIAIIAVLGLVLAKGGITGKTIIIPAVVSTFGTVSTSTQTDSTSPTTSSTGTSTATTGTYPSSSTITGTTSPSTSRTGTATRTTRPASTTSTTTRTSRTASRTSAATQQITCLQNNRVFTASVQGCRSSGGIVTDCIAGDLSNAPATSPTVTSQTAPSTTASAESFEDWLKRLRELIDRLKIHERVYVPGSYTCGGFATDLEKALEDAGFHATITAMVYWTGDHKSSDVNVRRRAKKHGHVITDVHSPDGRILFIEPQRGYFVDPYTDYGSDPQVLIFEDRQTADAGLPPGWIIT